MASGCVWFLQQDSESSRSGIEEVTLVSRPGQNSEVSSWGTQQGGTPPPAHRGSRGRYPDRGGLDQRKTHHSVFVSQAGAGVHATRRRGRGQHRCAMERGPPQQRGTRCLVRSPRGERVPIGPGPRRAGLSNFLLQISNFYNREIHVKGLGGRHVCSLLKRVQ